MCCFFRICLRLILTCKLFISIFICIVTGLFVIWALLITRQVLPPYLTTESDSKVTNTGSRDVSIDYEDNMKYVLLWSHSDYAPFYYFTEDAFKKNNCSFTNCYVTDNQTYFGGDLSKFHAIAFNGRILDAAMVNTPRWPHQKFIFFNTESSSIYKISNYFNGFFNWTATYRLNSDIVYPYMIIKDQFGKIVGPKLDMRWEPNMKEVDKEMQVRLLNKTKLAIAFVSNCNSQSQREKVWYQLNTALEARGYKIDVYGKCGNYKCPKSNATCYDLVNKYYFYMALENSYATDYVSEKVVRALQHDAVPVVLGGADYSRFLPPGSYLNVADYVMYDDLADLMVKLMEDPYRYLQFFKWKNYYTYHDALATYSVCELCKALNNKTKYETPSTYLNISGWWN